MRVRTEAADVAARVVLDNVPVPELQMHIVSFLAGPLEWHNMAVAARYGCMALLELLDVARIQDAPPSQQGTPASRSTTPMVICTSDAVRLAAAHGHRDVVKRLRMREATRL